MALKVPSQFAKTVLAYKVQFSKTPHDKSFGMQEVISQDCTDVNYKVLFSKTVLIYMVLFAKPVLIYNLFYKLILIIFSSECSWYCVMRNHYAKKEIYRE